ncbi:RusA family crossover junction endodeoxyribonuclease [Candidatus Arsenophonus triatominarum]|uniref:RusA family crossover junction endodeoxyribonuclease n=1 Tax=Candidatus Arsenophonus triatominarum TaxID=57911 RepID=UPI0007C561C1|nr:RusA family crossover junction endodeoxyribonuclease [Candidatus Arsenophonus triatominarum]
MKTYNITVPFPPSVNHYWYHAKHKHFITAKGRLYRQSVVAEIMRQKLCKRLSQRLGIEIGVHPADRRKRDLDNLMKAPIDALCHGGLIIDDSQIDVLHVERKEIIKGGKLVITIWEIA